MLYLLFILFPISMAATCFVLRKYTELIIVAAVGTVFTQAFFLAQIPLDDLTRILGIILSLNALNRLFIFLFLSIGALAFIVSWHLPHGENFIPVTLLMLALNCTVLLLQDPFLQLLLLLSASLTAVLAMVDLPTGAGALVGTRSIATAIKYLILMIIAGMLIYLSFVLMDIYQPGETSGQFPLTRFILALLTTGFALRFALIPFHTWLNDLVEDGSPMVTALVITIFQITSLLVMVLALQRFPTILIENPFGLTLLRIGGILTSVSAGLLTLRQASLRRTLAYLLIYNSGMVFYGLVSISEIGLMGAMFELFNQTLAIMLLFVSLALLEFPDGRPPGIERHDLLRRWPVAGLGFISGGLALLGLPPFSGYASKMLIYQEAAQRSWLEFLLLLLATALAGLGLARICQQKLLGASATDADLLGTRQTALVFQELLPPAESLAERNLKVEPTSTAVLILLLLVACLVIGLYPQPLLAMISDVIQSLTFVQAL